MRIAENFPPPPPERTFRLDVTATELEELLDGMMRAPRTKEREDMIETIMLAIHNH